MKMFIWLMLGWQGLAIFAADDAETLVREFVNAFNEKRYDTMLELVSDDVMWMSVAGSQIGVETKGRDQLKQAMEQYGKAIPSARSDIHQLSISGDFVHTLEEASWVAKEVRKSQCAMAVYQLENGKIKHVWYFAAHPCPK